MLLSSLGLVLKSRVADKWKVKDNYIYLIATIIAGLYVLLQEFGIHHLGGNNTFDPFDVVASILGLILTLLILNRFGLIVR